jgi:lysophospholipase L1-like esterase
MHRFPALPQPLRAVLGRKAIELDAVLHELGQDYLPMPARLDPDWIAADGFHPGPQAYAAWAQQIAPGLRTALTSVRWR